MLATVALLSAATTARADECAPAPKTWGATHGTSEKDESPVLRARDLLNRAKALDEAAVSDDKTVVDLTVRLPAMRLAAKVARDRADRAPGDDALAAKAEELEAEVVVGDAEIAVRRKTAIENRRVARELRARAVRLVREGSSADESVASVSCDPPFSFTSDGRKIYRIECFR